MYRKCWRRKGWIISAVFVAVVCVHYLRLLSLEHSSRAPDDPWGKIISSRPLLNVREGLVFSNTGSVSARPPLSLMSPDSVGLRGLQRYDCTRAIEGFPSPSKDFGETSVQRLSDKEILLLTSDCQNFRKRYGYQRYGQATKEELDFPLAFNILLYKEVEQLHLLLRAIYRPHNSYCLHVDGYAEPSVFEATRSLASCLVNVFLASRRENITYSGFSRLQADINCMEDHLNRTPERQGLTTNAGVPWRYLINLPSQNFPLRTNAELVKILTIYNGSNDVEGLTGARMLQDRYRFRHVYQPDPQTGRLKIVRTKEMHAPPPHNLTIVKGSAYGVFSRDFVRFVVQDARSKALLDWTRSVDSPDEYFWATLHHNPDLGTPGAYRGEPGNKPWLAVYASWPPRDLCASGKVVRGVCIFGVADLPQLLERKELFANKFYLDFQPAGVHCLDQWLYNRTLAALPLQTFYYRSLPFIRK